MDMTGKVLTLYQMPRRGSKGQVCNVTLSPRVSWSNSLGSVREDIQNSLPRPLSVAAGVIKIPRLTARG